MLRRCVAGQRCIAVRAERNRDRVAGDAHALERLLGCQLGDSARGEHLAPSLGGQLENSSCEPRLSRLFFLFPPAPGQGPGRPEFHVIRRVGKAAVQPVGHGHAVRIGMVDLGVDGKTTTFDAVDHVVFPQRAGSIQRWFVQAGGKVLYFQPTDVALRLVVKNMFVDVEICALFPVRTLHSHETNDQVERLSGFVEGLEFFNQPTTEICRAARRFFAQHEARNVLRTVVRFSQEKGEIQCGQFSHCTASRCPADQKRLTQTTPVPRLGPICKRHRSINMFDLHQFG